MALFTDATSTLERLTQLRTAADGAEEARALDSLRVELAALASPINALAAKMAVLRSEEVNLSAIPDLANVKGNVQTTLALFQQTPKATTLRRGKLWTTLTNRLQTLTNNAQTALNDDWRRYCDNNLFGGLPPAKQEATLAKTPRNEQSLARYRILYQSFIKHRQQLPTSADEFNNLRQLSQQLAEITFEKDVPEDVRKFLDALGSGAGLHLLTPAVLTWLRDNGLLASYVVRARIT